MAETHLFSSRPVSEYLDQVRASLNKEIETLSAATVLGTDLEALTTLFIQKYTVQVPRIDDDNIELTQEETKVDVSRDPLRVAMYVRPGQPAYVTGTKHTFHVPFTDGDPVFFRLRSSTYTTNIPEATVAEGKLRFTYEDAHRSATRIKEGPLASIFKTKIMVDEYQDRQTYSYVLVCWDYVMYFLCFTIKDGQVQEP